MYKSLILVTAMLLCRFTADAQSATGVLQGSVVDATGASVPGAKVTVENQRTSVKQTQLTNNEGRYVQPFLPPK